MRIVETADETKMISGPPENKQLPGGFPENTWAPTETETKEEKNDDPAKPSTGSDESAG